MGVLAIDIGICTVWGERSAISDGWRLTEVEV